MFMINMKRKRLVSRIFISSLSVFLTGCWHLTFGGDIDDVSVKGKNKDKSFSMVSSWTTSGLINHYNSNTSCNAFDFFVVEGLYRYVRSTDEIFSQLAEEGLPTQLHEVDIDQYVDEVGNDAVMYYKSLGKNKVSVTRAKIRQDATWQNGEDFIAKDVWAYYYIMHPTSSNYMIGVKVVDTKTIDFIWNPLKEPSDSVKNLLIAQDKSGTVNYNVFAKYVEPVHAIVMDSPVNTNVNLWGAFNRFSNDSQIVQLNIIKNKFFSYSPSWYIATGPFRMKKFSTTQILLEKNEFYWNAENIGFEKVKLYSSNDLNQTYQLIATDYVDYYDGFIQEDTLNSMLASNSSLINLKMYDPGAIGITYNFQSGYMANDKVREALQFVFDREEIKNASNPFATTSYYPTLGMAPSEAKMYMSEEAYNNLPTYSLNHQRANDLLYEAGWYKSGNRWYSGGTPVTLKMGAPSSHDISSTAAEAAAAQLTNFGIGVELLKTSNFYSNASADICPYDLLLEWTDLNMSFSYPTGSYNQFASMYSKWAHIERYPADYSDTQKAGNVKLVFKGLGSDPNEYEFADFINSFYSVDEAGLSYLVDVFNTGIANKHIGIQFFQNVTASTINVGKVKGAPLEEYWMENRNVLYVPEAESDDFYAVARTNFVYATNYLISKGYYQPNMIGE